MRVSAVTKQQTDEFRQHALFVAVACIRAAASRAGILVRQELGRVRPLEPHFQRSSVLAGVGSAQITAGAATRLHRG